VSAAPPQLSAWQRVVFGVLIGALGLVTTLWWGEHTRNSALLLAVQSLPPNANNNSRMAAPTTLTENDAAYDEGAVSGPEGSKSVEELLALAVLQDALNRNGQLNASGPSTEETAEDSGPSVVFSVPGSNPYSTADYNANYYPPAPSENVFQGPVNYSVQPPAPPPTYSPAPPDYSNYPSYPYYSTPFLFVGSSRRPFDSFSRRGLDPSGFRGRRG